MRLVRTLFVVVAGAALLVAVPSAEAAKKAKKEKEHNFKGVVTAVDADGKTIKITIAAKTNKKTNVTTQAEDKTFKVSEKTTYIKVVGKKPEAKDEPVALADVKEGQKVSLLVKGDEVQEVKFHAKKGKKKKNT